MHIYLKTGRVSKGYLHSNSPISPSQKFGVCRDFRPRVSNLPTSVCDSRPIRVVAYSNFLLDVGLPDAACHGHCHSAAATVSIQLQPKNF